MFYKCTGKKAKWLDNIHKIYRLHLFMYIPATRKFVLTCVYINSLRRRLCWHGAGQHSG